MQRPVTPMHVLGTVYNPESYSQDARLSITSQQHYNATQMHVERCPTVPPAVRRGSVGSRRDPGGPMETPWRAQGVRTSIVHQYGTVERPVEPCLVPSC